MEFSDFSYGMQVFGMNAREYWAWGTKRNWSFSWRLALGMEVVIGDKMIGEAASPFSFRSSFEHVSHLDAGHVSQPIEPWFRMKSISSADELMFSENTEMPF